VNARGEISRRSVPGAELVQQQRLAAEGVQLDARGRARLSRVRWVPRAEASSQRAAV
jgi:alkylated DNA nucleotide flippase Atl1